MLKKLKLLKKPLFQKRGWSCDFPPRKDGILYPRRVVLGLPSPSHRVCADGRTYGRTDGRSRDYYVRTNISWIDSLPNFLSNGAPLVGFARRLRYYVTTKISRLDTLPNFLSNGAPLAGFARRLRFNIAVQLIQKITICCSFPAKFSVYKMRKNTDKFYIPL